MSSGAVDLACKFTTVELRTKLSRVKAKPVTSTTRRKLRALHAALRLRRKWDENRAVGHVTRFVATKSGFYADVKMDSGAESRIVIAKMKDSAAVRALKK